MRILAALVLLLASLPLSAATGTPAPSPQVAESDSQPAQCIRLQGSLSRQTTALAELQARSQALSSQRELERMRNESRIQALENEKARLLSAAVIAVLILLLAAATGFGLLLRKRHRQLRRLSEIDVLTGLGNRRAAARKLDAMAIQRGPEGTRHVLFLIDVDHFKQINDRYGHAAGDQVLRQTASLVARLLRAGDVASRMGGEEFLILLPGTDAAEARALAQEMRKAIETERYAGLSEGLRITASFGVAQMEPRESMADLAARVDRLLYAAKRHGRNRVEVGSLTPSADSTDAGRH